MLFQNHYLKLTVSLFLVSLLSACVETKPMVINFQPTTVAYEYNIGQSTVSLTDIYTQVKEKLIPELLVIHEKRRFNDGTSISPIRGMEVNSTCYTETNCVINAVYINGKHYSSTGDEHLAIQTISIPVRLEQRGGIVHVAVELSGAISASSASGLEAMLTPGHLLKAPQIEAIYNSLASLRPSITVSEQYNGEVELPAGNDVVVYANFRRLMGLYDRSSEAGKTDIGMFSWFRLNTGSGVVPLGVTVYPTSKGALVAYSFSMKYVLTPDGATSFNPDAIAGLKRSIEQVAQM